MIPWVGPSLNKVWAGVHWQARKKIADAGHKACLVARSVPPFDGPVDIEFTGFISGRRYDCTNYAVTGKVIEDGLVKLGILKSDDAKFVLSVKYNTPVKAKLPGTLVTIRQRELV